MYVLVKLVCIGDFRVEDMARLRSKTAQMLLQVPHVFVDVMQYEKV